jgi:hypothetical protein
MSAPEIAEPLPAPTAIIDAIAAPHRAALQSAATEGRLEAATAYTFPELEPRASWVGVIGGVIGFFTFLTAVPMTVTNYLARTHSDTLQMQGFVLFALVVVNLALGFGMQVGHEWLHAQVARALGAKPELAPGAGQRLQWRASAQGFGRASYAAVLLGPLVIGAVLWLILWALAPIVAAFLIVAATVNAAMAGADLWTFLIALSQPAEEVAFVDQHPGFLAYRIAAAPAAKPAATSTAPKSSVAPKSGPTAQSATTPTGAAKSGSATKPSAPASTTTKSPAATATKTPTAPAATTKTPTKPGSSVKSPIAPTSAIRPSGSAARPATKPGTPTAKPGASKSIPAKSPTSGKSVKKRPK